jgi:hypothetical protein
MSISPANPKQTTGTCFVVMGFGKKTDFKTGRILDLNQFYLKPDQTRGLSCLDKMDPHG